MVTLLILVKLLSYNDKLWDVQESLELFVKPVLSKVPELVLKL